MRGMTYLTTNNRHIGVCCGLGSLFIVKYLEENTARKRYNQLPISTDPEDLQRILDETAAAKGWEKAGSRHILGTSREGE